jgi:hypothetical protein
MPQLGSHMCSLYFESWGISEHQSPILGGNIDTTYLPFNLVFHALMKHIEIYYHFVQIKFISYKDQLAHIFIYCHYLFYLRDVDAI